MCECITMVHLRMKDGMLSGQVGWVTGIQSDTNLPVKKIVTWRIKKDEDNFVHINQVTANQITH